MVGESPLLVTEELVKNSKIGRFWFGGRCSSKSRGSLKYWVVFTCKDSSSWPLLWLGSPVLAQGRPSCRDEEGKMGLFLSCGGTLGVTHEWRRRCRETAWVASRVSKTLSRLKREGGISLKMLQLKRASSRVDGRISWFFLSCGRKLGVPLKLPQGTDRVASGKSSLYESC